MTKSQETPVRKVLRRRWPRLLALLLLLGAGAGVTYRLLNPHLRPVTRRQLPSGYTIEVNLNTGYPVVQALTSGTSGEDRDITWLDARCRPIPGATAHTGEYTAYSPGWRVLADVGSPVPGHGQPVTFTNAKGQKQTLYSRGFVSDVDGKPCFTTLEDSGVFADLAGHLYLPDGKPLPLPRDGWAYYPSDSYIATPDPRLLPLLRSKTPLPPATRALAKWEPACLYDLRTRKIVFAYDFSVLTDVEIDALLRDGEWTAAIVDEASMPEVLIFHGNTLLDTLAANTAWYWGEDGTIWTVKDDTVQVLRWRGERAHLVPTRIHVPEDGRFANWRWTGATGCTVWGDGALIACAETVPTMPDRVYRTLAGINTRFRLDKNIPREARRLTLYRQGKRAGSFMTLIPPYVVSGTPQCPESLAFSRDGKYLAWVLEMGDGARIFAFPTR